MPGTRAVHDADDPAVAEPRDRSFWLLLTGSSVSMLGSRVTTIAYPLLVLAMTGSPVMAGWACFAATAPSILFYLPAGALVDRCNPRVAMLICEAVRGAVIAIVVGALLASRLTVALLIAAAVVEEILEVFSTLAERRLALSLVDPGKAASALAQTEARTHMAVMVGRPLGALLFGISHVLPFIADCLSFSASVVTLLHIGKHQKKGAFERAPKTRLTDEIGEGFNWLRRHQFALVALPLTAGTTLVGQALIMVFLGEAHSYHLTVFAIGIILAASGAGGALGSAVAPWLFRHFGYSLFKTQLTSWVVTFFVLTLWGGRSFIGVAIVMTILGFTGALGNIALDTYIVQNSEETILARVISVSWLISFVALALGPLMGGLLLKECGAQDAIFALFIAAAVLRTVAPATPQARTHYRNAGKAANHSIRPERLGTGPGSDPTGNGPARRGGAIGQGVAAQSVRDPADTDNAGVGTQGSRQSDVPVLGMVRDAGYPA